MKFSFCNLVLFFSFFSCECIAQQGMLPTRVSNSAKMENLDGLVVIINNTGGSKIYATSVDKINWNAQTLASGYRHIYRIRSFSIRIKSNSGQVEYLLEAGNSYSIVWNEERGIWDLSHDP